MAFSNETCLKEFRSMLNEVKHAQSAIVDKIESKISDMGPSMLNLTLVTSAVGILLTISLECTQFGFVLATWMASYIVYSMIVGWNVSRPFNRWIDRLAKLKNEEIHLKNTVKHWKPQESDRIASSF